jgi:hypothetical protein
LETNKGNTMTIRIVIIAACAGTLALAQADVARAQSALVNTTHSNIRHPGVVKNGAKTGTALPKAGEPIHGTQVGLEHNVGRMKK